MSLNQTKMPGSSSVIIKDGNRRKLEELRDIDEKDRRVLNIFNNFQGEIIYNQNDKQSYANKTVKEKGQRKANLFKIEKKFNTSKHEQILEEMISYNKKFFSILNEKHESIDQSKECLKGWLAKIPIDLTSTLYENVINQLDSRTESMQYLNFSNFNNAI